MTSALTAAITQPLRFPFYTDGEVESERQNMERLLEPEISNESRLDADNTPPNLNSQAVATQTRKSQKMRAVAVELEPKKLSPLLGNTTPTAFFLGLPPEVLYEVSSTPVVN